jgi:hypothetical protein
MVVQRFPRARIAVQSAATLAAALAVLLSAAANFHV